MAATPDNGALRRAGHEHGIHAGRFRAAQASAEIARVFDVVEREQERLRQRGEALLEGGFAGRSNRVALRKDALMAAAAGKPVQGRAIDGVHPNAGIARLRDDGGKLRRAPTGRHL